MQTQITNLLLIIFLILFMYCIMYHFIYKIKKIKYDNDDNYTDIDIDTDIDSDVNTDTDVNTDVNTDTNTDIDIINNMITKSERFALISDDEAEQNLQNLKTLQTHLNTYNVTYLPQFNSTVNDAKNQIANQEIKISNLLTNKYIIQYIDSINKANAASYREFIKYKKNEKLNML